MGSASRRGPLLVGLAVVVLVALVAALLYKCGAGTPTAESPASFSFENLSASSPGLPVAVDVVRGTLRDGYLDWACLLRCRRPEGCHADLRLTVRYRSGGDEAEIVFHGTMDVAEGSRARFGGVQRPARRVEGITGVEVEVLRTFEPGDPVPTPEL
jgi:hypothetical protein